MRYAKESDYLAKMWPEVEARIQNQHFDMNFYDLLRKLINGGSWSEEERNAAITLVNTLESVGVFGGIVDKIHEKGQGI